MTTQTTRKDNIYADTDIKVQLHDTYIDSTCVSPVRLYVPYTFPQYRIVNV